MFHKDFCVDVDIVVFKVEVAFFKAWQFCSKTAVVSKLGMKTGKEDILGPKRPKVVSLIRVLANYFRPHFEFFMILNLKQE